MMMVMMTTRLMMMMTVMLSWCHDDAFNQCKPVLVVHANAECVDMAVSIHAPVSIHT